ncbi:MAG: glycosyltransferase N-terminal domain-containing protein [Candidatus Cloacimonadaceae bacterium]|jgi:3-deoxy-D-manno-octulosonic-acid transferase
MIRIIQYAILCIFNVLIEGVYRVFYPVLRFFLKRIDYDSALDAAYEVEKGCVWIHAASLGEINAVRSFVLALCDHVPANEIVITTTTVNGLKAAQKLHPEIKAYLSVVDVPSLRAKQFEQIAPRLICIVETEIWPNFLLQAKKADVPVLFLNARISVKTIRRLKPLKALLSYLGASIKLIMAKSELDAQRFKQLFDVDILVAGNLKYALSPQEYPFEETRQKWGFQLDDFVVCFGSSRPKEEALILDIMPQLLDIKPNLKLILAPRHPNRVAEVQKLCADYQSKLMSEKDFDSRQERILIIDGLGYLNQAYSICDLALVGGSFYDFGGHNPMEPAYYGKAIIMGPYHSSCAESVEQLQAAEAIQISDANNILDTMRPLLEIDDRRLQMGQSARELLVSLRVSLDNHLNGVLEWIK